ncbi:hypothetical protein MHB54_04160 [Paenibacillus sp. FSL M7-0802]|uniref:hypothetical protein n=1 Tax=Paenibacillus TaxID=44249 RepID=UPI0003D35D3E|nr:hypothetical protein [Paenibacillus polymyxa]AIW41774.1 hypothetical protein X809_38485 [Paenibacillus polymyxa CR1]
MEVDTVEKDLLNVEDLDAIVHYIRMCYTSEDWERLLRLTEHLYMCAKSTYEATFNNIDENIHSKELKQPLVFYYGYSHLMRGVAHLKMQNYTATQDCIEKYSELGWFNGLDKDGLEVVENFKLLAKLNQYELQMFKGNKHIIPEYIKFLEMSPEDDWLPAHVSIVEAALQYGWDIDSELASMIHHSASFAELEDYGNIFQFIDYSYHLALYHLRKDKFVDALKCLLQALESSIKIEDGKYFKRCVALFEAFRGFATPSQLDSYALIFKKILEGELKNEKGIYYFDNRIRFDHPHTTH